MKHLGELRRDAEESTKKRGHTINWSPPYHSESQSAQRGFCVHRNQEVYLVMNPAPNEIEISGEAVALNCQHFLP